jgi:integrase
MTRVCVKGIKRYRSKGRWYVYHRKTGERVEAEFGTAVFFNELATLERRVKREAALPGTLGGLLAAYRASRAYLDLASSTRAGYARMMNLLMPIHDMPLAELTPQFVAGLRDRVAEKHGRRQANYVMAVISVACEHGREHGIVRENPVKGIKRVRRDRQAPRANRPWTPLERRVVIQRVPRQLRVPVALAMFTGLRKGDVLRLLKSAIREGRIWRRTAKTGHEMSIPLHPDLVGLLSATAPHDAITVAATSNGTPWTESGFNSTFIKAIRRLEREGAVQPGLTFHGLRQKTLAMAIHYSETAETTDRMAGILARFDPLGSKTRT